METYTKKEILAMSGKNAKDPHPEYPDDEFNWIFRAKFPLQGKETSVGEVLGKAQIKGEFFLDPISGKRIPKKLYSQFWVGVMMLFHQYDKTASRFGEFCDVLQKSSIRKWKKYVKESEWYTQYVKAAG